MSCLIRMAFGQTTTRMAAVQNAAERYLQQLRATNPRQQVAVVGFSSTATLYHRLAPVGAAMGSLCRAVRSLHPQGRTNLSAGLSRALNELARIRAIHRSLVVITDGAATDDTHLLSGLIRRARGSRVRIVTIGVGNRADADYDPALLGRMAHATGGGPSLMTFRLPWLRWTWNFR